MNPRIRSHFFFLLFLFLTSSLAADTFEIAPFVGYRFGGHFTVEETGESITMNSDPSAGVNLSFNTPIPNDFIELHYSRQDGVLSGDGLNQDIGVRIEYWQGGILREYNYDDWRPFLVGSLGMSRFDFSTESADTNLFSVGMGGGAKYFPADWIGIRFDAKAYLSFISGSTAIKCSGGCAVSYQGDVFWQGELATSVVIKY